MGSTQVGGVRGVSGATPNLLADVFDLPFTGFGLEPEQAGCRGSTRSSSALVGTVTRAGIEERRDVEGAATGFVVLLLGHLDSCARSDPRTR